MKLSRIALIAAMLGFFSGHTLAAAKISTTLHVDSHAG